MQFEPEVKDVYTSVVTLTNNKADWKWANVDSAASFLGYLYIVSQYTVRLMTPCVWRILCLRNSSSVPYFRQPPNLPTAARQNRKCTKCGMTAFGQNQMSADSAHLSTFGTETEAEAEIRSTSRRGAYTITATNHDGHKVYHDGHSNENMKN